MKPSRQLLAYEKTIFIFQLIVLGILAIIKVMMIFEVVPFINDMGGIQYLFFAAISGVLIVSWFYGLGFKWAKIHYKQFHLWVLLMGLSAFCFNGSGEGAVFGAFSWWVEPLILVSFTGVVMNLWKEKLPDWARHLSMILIGLGVGLNIYFCFVLVPLYYLGIIGLVAFGIGILLLSPLFVLGVMISIFVQIERREYRTSFVIAAVLPLAIAAYFLTEFNNFQRNVNEQTKIEAKIESDIPKWIRVGQKVHPKPLTTYFLEYATGFKGGFDAFERRGANEIHDPLVNTAKELIGDISLNEVEAERIAGTMVDLRHSTTRRLWSGKNLETTTIKSFIEIYPEFRLAYNEKTFTIKSHPNNSRRRERPKEAVYTFHLPEGSIATSLSLWVNGIERKSRLSAKAIADSAYRTIVGVERRDPALLHWQEGNTLTVTVFPCTPEVDRMFKLGVTTPLRKEGDELVLENILFEGPEGKNAYEELSITFNGGEPEEFDLPGNFSKMERGIYTLKRPYKPAWEMRMTAPPLSGEQFEFNGFAYQLSELDMHPKQRKMDRIYLDIDKTWVKEDFTKVVEWAKAHSAKIYVHDNELIEVTAENQEQVFREARRKNFGIFPLFKIEEPERALLVSHSTLYSPDLSSLSESSERYGTNEFALPFKDQLANYVKANDAIPLWHFGEELSPYLKSLVEFRHLKYAAGSLDELVAHLNKNQFPEAVEDDGQVVIHTANITVKRDTLENVAGETRKKQAAPDHLMRLFAYNHIMQQIGPGIIAGEGTGNDVVKEASLAHVISPVSSMIVLETDEDYERFGIEEDADGLGNAKALKKAYDNGSGAVPEPHEWALIILALLAATWLFMKKRAARLRNG